MDFELSVSTEFQFLESNWEFTRGAFTETRWSKSVLYKNETTGVNVLYEWHGELLMVMLYRLVDGELPVYKTVGERDRDDTNGFSLLDLVGLRVTQNEFSELIVRRDQADLQGKCHVLVSGDFRVFAKLGKIKAERRRSSRT
jgi:hypothetical protein